MRTIIEPFRIKMTEALPITTRQTREERLTAAHYNVFLLDAEDITIDLLTDSGTGAMSDRQWAALMMGDESYAGSRSWRRFEKTIRDITGFKHIFPTHQGRAAERILAATRLKPGDIVPNNSHFDTTRANVEYVGATALDLPSAKAADIHAETRFKGDIDLEALRACAGARGEENSLLHDHGDQQYRRRPAGLAAQYSRGQGSAGATWDSTRARRLPLRRERLFHQAVGGRLCATARSST